MAAMLLSCCAAPIGAFGLWNFFPRIYPPRVLQDDIAQPVSERVWDAAGSFARLLPDPYQRRLSIEWRDSDLSAPLGGGVHRTTRHYSTSFFPTNAEWLDDGTIAVAGIHSKTGAMIVEKWSLSSLEQPPRVQKSIDQNGDSQLTWTLPSIAQRVSVIDGVSSCICTPESICEMSSSSPRLLVRVRETKDVLAVEMAAPYGYSLVASGSSPSSALHSTALLDGELLSFTRHQLPAGGFTYTLSNTQHVLHNLDVSELKVTRLMDADGDGVLEGIEGSTGTTALGWLDNTVW